jgi:aryl-alcohol dehydrogenase-like predicted oxidoreductase
VSKLGLGTVQFGQTYGLSGQTQISHEMAATLLARAAQAGIKLLDTAANYGDAEKVLASLDTSYFRIVTKTATVRHGVDSVILRARESAALLKPDTLLVHAAADLDDPALWPALLRLKREGIFARIGISAYVDENPVALAQRFRPDVMQIPLNLFDQRLLLDGTLERLRDMGVEIHARSLFLQGLLLMAPEAVPTHLLGAASHLAVMRTRLAEAGATPLAAALAFVLKQPEIAVGLVGLHHVRQLDEVLQAIAAPLPTLDWRTFSLDDVRILTPPLWNK